MRLQWLAQGLPGGMMVRVGSEQHMIAEDPHAVLGRSTTEPSWAMHPGSPSQRGGPSASSPTFGLQRWGAPLPGSSGVWLLLEALLLTWTRAGSLCTVCPCTLCTPSEHLTGLVVEADLRGRYS